ncbi:viperin family antiviral radical SAM protein [bacterium]|nr:viperin family antiviral radical SAM protein [bacterium]
MEKTNYVFNWHVTSKCNYHCRFCYAEWEKMPEIWDEPPKVAALLKNLSESRLFEKGRTRLNIAGGEPVMNMKKLTPVIETAWSQGFVLSIITNGSHLENLMPCINKFSMVGISVDSASDENNIKIGRCTSKGQVMTFSELCEKVDALRVANLGLIIKINSVVNAFNWNENLLGQLKSVGAQKYKILRQMPFNGDKGVSDDQWRHFLELNHHPELNTVIEDNEDMTHSYLMIAPDGRFFQNGGTEYAYSSHSLWEKPADELLGEMDFDEEKFKSRYTCPDSSEEEKNSNF